MGKCIINYKAIHKLLACLYVPLTQEDFKYSEKDPLKMIIAKQLPVHLKVQYNDTYTLFTAHKQNTFLKVRRPM